MGTLFQTSPYLFRCAASMIAGHVAPCLILRRLRLSAAERPRRNTARLAE